MTELLVSAGIACIIGAIVGGRLKAFGIELPVLQALWRQLALAGFGGALLGIGVFIPVGPAASTDNTPTPPLTPAAATTPTPLPTPTSTPTPLPTVNDFAGSWFNWNQEHEFRDVSILNEVVRVL